MILPHAIKRVHQCLQSIGAQAVIVGGYVRDTLMEISDSKDIDIEVYNIADITALKRELSTLASVYEVGRSFGVLKISLDGYEFDISLPRTESKTGRGHRGFSVALESGLEFKEAAKRRDFTMNAIGFDLDSASYIDPYNGQEDIQKRVIRVVDPNTFIEDPLRLLRAVQFAARFEFDMEANTLQLCQDMVKQKMLDELAKERIFDEIKKLLLKSKNPSIGFGLLDKMGALFPEIKSLQGVEQSPVYHPEGDVYVHTMMSIDAMASRSIDDEKEKLILMLAVLCHDFGKPITTEMIDGKIRAIAHETVGVEVTLLFLKRFSDEVALFEAVTPLVEHHLKPSQFFADRSTDSAIRRLSTKVSINRLIEVAQADFFGRTTVEALSAVYEAGSWLKQRCEDLDVLNKAPKPLIQGRDLIALGLEPGKVFKLILDKSYEEQLNGTFTNHKAALEWIKVTEIVKTL